MTVIEFIFKFIHVIISVLLVVVILLQSSKGGGLSGTFGGQASSAIFGARGTASALTTVTKYLAVIFLALSLVLSMIAGRGVATQSITQEVMKTAPAAQLRSLEDIKYEPGSAGAAATEEGTVLPPGSEEPATQEP